MLICPAPAGDIAPPGAPPRQGPIHSLVPPDPTLPVTGTPAGALPLFTPDRGLPSGLDLLAVAANIQSPASPPALLHTPGPYNPGATVSTTVAAKILSLKFIEMSEVGADDLNPTGRPAPPRLPVSDISVWVEKFSTMAAIMVQRFPEKAPELFAYQALIVRCERNYRASQWIAYDRAFRREALAAHDLNWSLPNPRLFQEAFTGRARDIPRCNLCLNDDHTTESCPTNPQRAFGYLPPPSSNPPPPPPSYWGRAAQPPRDSRRQSQELCHR